MSTKFWQSVSELAKLRSNVPPERRALSGVRWRYPVRQPGEHITANRLDPAKWDVLHGLGMLRMAKESREIREDFQARLADMWNVSPEERKARS